MILLLISFTIISILVINENVLHFNLVIIGKIQLFENENLTSIMIFITNLGAWFIYVPLALLFLIIPRSRIKIGIPALFSLSLATVLNLLLKAIFKIPRPDLHRLINETGFGFPSGHAMIGTAFIGILIYLFLQYPYKRTLKIILLFISVLFLLCLGFSRIYLGVHNPTDILGGYSAGLFVFMLSIIIMKKVKVVT